jgi:hypothetical protein
VNVHAGAAVPSRDRQSAAGGRARSSARAR